MSEIPKQPNTEIPENPSSERIEEKDSISLTRLIADRNDPKLSTKYEEELRLWHEIHQENKRLKEELEEQRKIIEEQALAIQERDTLIHELSYDSVTDLKIRSLFYRKLNTLLTEHIAEALGKNMNQLEHMPMEEFTEAMTSVDASKLEKIPLTILMSDAAYLSLANKESHDTGDGLLKQIGGAGKKIAEEFPGVAEFYRYGGDEIGGILLTENKMVSQHISEKFENEVAKIDFDYLRKFGIEPKLHIDIGTSDLSEGFAAFQKFLAEMRTDNGNLSSEDLPMTIPAGERLKTFTRFWIGISDERATLHKAERRIPLLKFYKEHHPEVYANIISNMRKGALDATDEEMDALDNDSESIKQFIVGKRIEMRESSTPSEEEKMIAKRKALASDIIGTTAAKTFLAR